MKKEDIKDGEFYIFKNLDTDDPQQFDSCYNGNIYRCLSIEECRFILIISNNNYTALTGKEEGYVFYPYTNYFIERLNPLIKEKDGS